MKESIFYSCYQMGVVSAHHISKRSSHVHIRQNLPPVSLLSVGVSALLLSFLLLTFKKHSFIFLCTSHSILLFFFYLFFSFSWPLTLGVVFYLFDLWPSELSEQITVCCPSLTVFGRCCSGSHSYAHAEHRCLTTDTLWSHACFSPRPLPSPSSCSFQ